MKKKISTYSKRQKKAPAHLFFASETVCGLSSLFLEFGVRLVFE